MYPATLQQEQGGGVDAWRVYQTAQSMALWTLLMRWGFLSVLTTYLDHYHIKNVYHINRQSAQSHWQHIQLSKSFLKIRGTTTDWGNKNQDIVISFSTWPSFTVCLQAGICRGFEYICIVSFLSVNSLISCQHAISDLKDFFPQRSKTVR